MWAWIAGGTLALLAAVAWSQHRARRGIYRPLASRRPAMRPRAGRPLGTEATDLEAVARVQRRNDSLERGRVGWMGGLSFLGRGDLEVDPWADDETYAARYHAAFQTREKDRRK